MLLVWQDFLTQFKTNRLVLELICFDVELLLDYISLFSEESSEIHDL